jgi:hypothetical protein
MLSASSSPTAAARGEVEEVTVYWGPEWLRRASSKGCGESELAQGTCHIERTLRRLSLLHSSRKSLLEGQIGEKQ